MGRQGSVRDISARGCVKPRLRAPWQGHREVLLVKLGFPGFPYLTAAPTEGRFLLTTDLERSDGSLKYAPCPEQDLALAEVWLTFLHLGSSRLVVLNFPEAATL